MKKILDLLFVVAFVLTSCSAIFEGSHSNLNEETHGKAGVLALGWQINPEPTSE